MLECIFFVRIQQRKHLKTGKYLEVHAQITNQKNNLCHSKIFRLYLVDDKLLKNMDVSCHSLGFWSASYENISRKMDITEGKHCYQGCIKCPSVCT